MCFILIPFYFDLLYFAHLNSDFPSDKISTQEEALKISDITPESLAALNAGHLDLKKEFSNAIQIHLNFIVEYNDHLSLRKSEKCTQILKLKKEYMAIDNFFKFVYGLISRVTYEGLNDFKVKSNRLINLFVARLTSLLIIASSNIEEQILEFYPLKYSTLVFLQSISDSFLKWEYLVNDIVEKSSVSK